MKSIFVYQHLGLGDHIVCNGLTRTILDRENADKLYLPVKECNYPSVAQMYKDLKNIKLLPIDSNANNTEYESKYKFEDAIKADKIYKIYSNGRPDWDKAFYNCVDIPFRNRWEASKINRDKYREEFLEGYLNPNRLPFILVHNMYSTKNDRANLKINTTLKIINVEQVSNCIFDWCGLIEKAKEIHCLDSSFIHLCQSMGVDGYFHNFKRKDRFGSKDKFVLLPNWKIIEY